MRRHVTPSLPTATIPDPERGDALPPEGRTVVWTPYWAGLEIREEITVGDPMPETPEPEAEPIAPEIAPTDAGTPPEV